jgi:hypothetical protein
LQAADKALATIQNDPGFAETSALLTQLAVSANKPDPAAHLAAHGFALSAHSSVAEVAAAIHRILDAKTQGRGSHSDFSELAQNSLVGAVTKHLNDGLGSLLAPTSLEVHGSLAKLGRPTQFASLSRTFFAGLSRNCLDYFLSKTLNSQIGTGQRFATTDQVATFQEAMAKHSYEASEIVERFCHDWFSKNRFTGGGDITRQQSARFGWYAVKKMRDELRMRAKPDAR